MFGKRKEYKYMFHAVTTKITEIDLAEIIRYIVTGVFMAAITAIVASLRNRKVLPKEGETADRFTVCMPRVLSRVYWVMLILGSIMLITFTYFRLTGNTTVTNGHVVISLCLMAIGILVMVWSSNWSIRIEGDTLAFRHLFRKEERISVRQIEHIEIGSKGQMSLYWNGKKQITIDALTDNFDMLTAFLRNNTCLLQ